MASWGPGGGSQPLCVVLDLHQRLRNSVHGQVEYMLGSECHMVSVAPTQFYYCSVKGATDYL